MSFYVAWLHLVGRRHAQWPTLRSKHQTLYSMHMFMSGPVTFPSLSWTIPVCSLKSRQGGSPSRKPSMAPEQDRHPSYVLPFHSAVLYYCWYQYFINIFMLWFLDQNVSYLRAGTLVDLGASLFISWGCHTALNKCFMNQCLRVDMLKSISLTLCGPGILKIKRHFSQHREELSKPVDGKNCFGDLESSVLRGALT